MKRKKSRGDCVVKRETNEILMNFDMSFIVEGRNIL